MKKFNGKYCTVKWKPIELNKPKFIRELIKKVNEIREANGLYLLDSDDLDQGWQNMPIDQRVEMKMRRAKKQNSRKKMESSHEI